MAEAQTLLADSSLADSSYVPTSLTRSRLLTYPEVRDRLRISAAAFFRLLARGGLPVVKVGGWRTGVCTPFPAHARNLNK